VASDKGFDHPVEEARRQEAVVVSVAVRELAQVVAGAEKFIVLGDDDPRAIIVQAEMPFDRQGYLDGRGWIGRSAVGDRQDSDDGRAVRIALDRQDDDAGSVFAPLFLSGRVFALPEIGIRDDEPWFRVRDRRAAPLFRIEHGIEMRVPRVHAGRTDGSDLFLRQLGGGEASAALLEALELLIFVRADEVAGDLPMARHGNGLALGAHPVAAEIAGELRSRDSLGRIHRPLSISSQYM
jgi:hypothetical protein